MGWLDSFPSNEIFIVFREELINSTLATIYPSDAVDLGLNIILLIVLFFRKNEFPGNSSYNRQHNSTKRVLRQTIKI